MALLKSDVPIREVVTTDPEKAKALENDVRAKIIDMLADEEMTIEGFMRGTPATGRGQGRDDGASPRERPEGRAGMVEIARLEEAGGGTRKYYKSNTRMFSYDLPEGSDQTLSAAQEHTTEELRTLLESLYETHGDDIELVAEEMKPCEYCGTQHYEEFIIRELLNRALLELGETGDLDDVLSQAR